VKRYWRTDVFYCKKNGKSNKKMEYYYLVLVANLIAAIQSNPAESRIKIEIADISVDDANRLIQALEANTEALDVNVHKADQSIGTAAFEGAQNDMENDLLNKFVQLDDNPTLTERVVALEDKMSSLTKKVEKLEKKMKKSSRIDPTEGEQDQPRSGAQSNMQNDLWNKFVQLHDSPTLTERVIALEKRLDGLTTRVTELWNIYNGPSEPDTEDYEDCEGEDCKKDQPRSGAQNNMENDLLNEFVQLDDSPSLTERVSALEKKMDRLIGRVTPLYEKKFPGSPVDPYSTNGVLFIYNDPNTQMELDQPRSDQ
jgi:hypothetical protein